MKIKYIMLISILLVLCGCQKLNDKPIDSITNKIYETIDNANVFRTGYSYYLPNSLAVKEYNDFNDVIESDENIFYLYVDLISYYNKKNFNFEKSYDSYYSNVLSKDDKTGYVEINLKENDKYLIEIMYNYAKIEVMVDKNNMNVALNYAVGILRSIKYQDSIIEHLVSSNVLSYQEEIYDIFTKVKNKENYLTVSDDSNVIEDDIKDNDLIN